MITHRMITFLRIIIFIIQIRILRGGNSLCIRQQRPFENFQPLIDTSKSSFKTFVEKSTIFVDKTLLIEEVLTNSRTRNRIVFIYYPEDSGKTMNLQMLKTFLEPEVGEKKIVEWTDTWSYKFFTSGKITENHTLREPPKISQYDYIVDKFLGKYPVIYLDFSASLPNPMSYSNFKNWFLKIVDAAFRPHEYLIRTPIQVMDDQFADIRDRDAAREWFIKFDSYFKFGTVNETQKLIGFLSELLYNFHNKMVFILIDNFDYPFTVACGDFVHDDDLTSIQEFLQDFVMTTFYRNTFVTQALISGTNRSVGGMCSKGILDPLEVHFQCAEDSIFNNFFGFSKVELNELFEKTDVPEEVQKEAYLTCACYTNHRNRTFYKTRAIANIVNTKKIKQEVFATASYDYEEFAKWQPSA